MRRLRATAHPADRGGATAWGITEAVARAEGRTQATADLPRNTAISICHRRYWLAPSLDRIAALDFARRYAATMARLECLGSRIDLKMLPFHNLRISAEG